MERIHKAYYDGYGKFPILRGINVVGGENK
jgi:hypothetical protein